MRVAVDTNVLVRAAVGDDSSQARSAARVLRSELVAISTTALCEFAWVLKSVYRFTRRETFNALSALINADNAAIDGPTVEAGLEVLQNGGDFADGVIAHEGARLGGETFVSFDRKALTCVAALGRPTKPVD